ncbi:MAG: FkbM family methyltransferase [Phycisphaerales bacterium]|nr:FkbM family methyltransferase [Phycisphaerales bacterium]
MIIKIKSVAHKLGVFPLARSVYRRLNSRHRGEREVNRNFYRQIINKGDLCFDIGANVGQSIEVFNDLGARIVAVEPNPNCLSVLRFQFGRNPNITLLHKGMGSRPGTAELHFLDTDSTASMRADWPYPTDQTVEVEIDTLDNLIAQFGRPRFIKIDVEGFELEVFKGLSEPIPLIYFEMHGHEIERAKQILEHLDGLGEIIGVNATDAHNSVWLIDEWVAPDQLIERLGNPLPKVANIVVKMNT